MIPFFRRNKKNLPSAQKSSSHVDFGYTQLEKRQVLNADFLFDGFSLQLNNFVDSNALDPDNVTITRAGNDYIFTLGDGVWSGMDTSGGMGASIAGLGTNTLTVTDAGGDLVSIVMTDDTADTFDVEFGSFSFNGNFDINAGNGTFGNLTQTAGIQMTDLSFNVDTATLNNAANDFDTLAGTSNNDTSISDVDDITNLNLTSTNGNLTVNAGGGVSITGIDAQSGNLDITANGLITDGGAGSLLVAGTTALNAGGNDISLTSVTNDFDTDNSGDAVTITNANNVTIDDANSIIFGNVAANDLSVDAGGNVDFQGTVNANSLDVNTLVNGGAGGNVTDTGLGELNVTNNANFVVGAGDVNLDTAAVHNFGTISFTSTGSVTIVEADNTEVTGNNTAGTLNLNSAGSITDAANTSIVVTGQATFTAANQITLNDNAGDTLNVANRVISSGTSITIGGAGTFLAGALNFNSAGAVNIQEDSATFLDGNNTANSLVLNSTSLISNLANTSLIVTNDATFNAGAAINLLGNAGDVLNVGGKAAFSGASITVGPAGTFTAASINFNSAGAVAIQEDDSTEICLANTAGSLDLNSAGTITDQAGATVNVTNDAAFTANGAITLTEAVGNVLSVGGKAAFTGTTITIGPAGQFTAGSLNFNSAGAVTIQEDDATIICDMNTSGTLNLTSAGSITDAANTSIVVNGQANLTATNGITLNDNAGDTLNVANRVIANGTSISIGGAGTFFAGALNFNSGGAVNIQEDNDSFIDGNNTAGSLALSSAGNISNLANVSVVVTNDATFNATGIVNLLGNAGDVLNVGGKAAFSGISVTVGPAGMFTAGTLNFNSAGAVSIQEDDATEICLANTAGSLDLDSAGAITDQAGATIAVTNLADFNGTSINLNNAASHAFGTLTFNSAGNVTIIENDAMDIIGNNTANDLALTSGGNMSDGGAGTITVVGTTSLDAGGNDISLTSVTNDFDSDNSGDTVSVSNANNVSIDDANSIRFGAFNASGNVDIDTEGFVSFQGNAVIGGNLDVDTDRNNDSTGGIITDFVGGQLTVTGTSTFDAGTAHSITLINANNDFMGAVSVTQADDVFIDDTNALIFGNVNADVFSIDAGGNVDFQGTVNANTLDVNTLINGGTGGNVTDTGTDELNITNNASFVVGTGDVVLDNAGVHNFGSITFTSTGNVTIVEADDMLLEGANTANNATLTSAGNISDGANADLVTTNNATFNATGNVNLADDAGNTLNVGGKASFAGATITVGPAGNFTAGTLNFNSIGAVNIQEDDATVICDNNSAGVLVINSGGSITDQANTDIVVNGTANLNSPGAINLNDSAGDLLNITNKLTINGSSINIGGTGTFFAGELNFNSAGAVTIQEDNDMIVCGNNTANSLNLSSTGALSEQGNTSIVVTNDATFAAGGAVNLLDNAADVLSVGGKAAFAGSTITVGPAGMFTAGTLNFNSAGAVAIQEDNATVICDTNTAGSLNLTTNGSITNLANTSVTVAGTADLIAGTPNGLSPSGSNNEFDIILGNQANDVFNINTIEVNAFRASIQLDADVFVSNTFVGQFAGGQFNNGSLILSSTGFIQQVNGTTIRVDQAGFVSGEHIFLGNTVIDRVAANAFGSVDVTTLTGVPSNLPTSMADPFAPRFNGIDANYGIVISNQGDLVVGGVTDALAVQGTIQGFFANNGHVFIETVAGGTPGDLIFTGQNSVIQVMANGINFGLAGNVTNGHAITTIAANDLTIANNTMLSSASGTVTDISPFVTPEGMFFMNIVLEGPFMNLFLPTPGNNPTTQIVGADNTQRIGLDIGRAGEQHFLIEVFWADGVTDVFDFNGVQGQQFVQVAHAFNPAFLFANFVLPTNFSLYNDPGINLFDQAGANNMNMTAINLNTNSNFVLAFSQSIPVGTLDVAEIEIEELATVESFPVEVDAVPIPESETFEFEESAVVEFDEVSNAELYFVDENNQETLVRLISENETVTPDTISKWRTKVNSGSEFPPGKYRLKWTDNGVPFSIEFTKDVSQDLDEGDGFSANVDLESTTEMMSAEEFAAWQQFQESQIVLPNQAESSTVTPAADTRDSDAESELDSHSKSGTVSKLGVSAGLMALAMTKVKNSRVGKREAKGSSQDDVPRETQSEISFSKLARSQRKIKK